MALHDLIGKTQADRGADNGLGSKLYVLMECIPS